MGMLLAGILFRVLSVPVGVLIDGEVALGGEDIFESVGTATLLVERMRAGAMSASLRGATLLVGAMDAAGAVDVVETLTTETVPARPMVEAAFASGLAVGGKP